MVQRGFKICSRNANHLGKFSHRRTLLEQMLVGVGLDRGQRLSDTLVEDEENLTLCLLQDSR